MNKKTCLAIFIAFNVVAMTIITSVPVHAYTYHGYTSSWDRGDDYAFGGLSSADHDTGTGFLDMQAVSGSAWAYLNSAHVDAIADVSSITVTAFWENGYKYKYFGAYSFECRLYVNGEFQEIKYASFDNWNDGYEQFTFTGLDVDTNDDLDVDIKFVGVSGPGYSAYLSATFLYIAFVTY